MAAGDLDPSVVAAVSNSNFKVLSEAAAFAMGLAYQDSVDVQRNVRAVTTAAISKAITQLVEPMEEAAAVGKIATGNDLAQQITQLLAAIGSNAQTAKVVYSTVPSNEPAPTK